MQAANPNKPPLRFRKLRIAFSAVCGVFCLLLIALWVRSYWWADSFQYAGVTSTSFNFNPGVIDFARSDTDPQLLGPMAYRWRHFSRTSPERPTDNFFWLWTDTDFAIRVPVWCCIAVFAGASALPWIRWRFRLRTLLIAMTLTAVIFGTIAIAARD
jgi:hypothetical protein